MRRDRLVGGTISHDFSFYGLIVMQTQGLAALLSELGTFQFGEKDLLQGGFQSSGESGVWHFSL